LSACVWRAPYAGLLSISLALAATRCEPKSRDERSAPADTKTLPLRAAEATLPSWRESPAKRALVDFVARVTAQGGPDFVPPAERIAVFDNDGTLWSEKPLYVQLAFAIDRVKELALQHPEWRSRQPFEGLLEGDLEAAAAA